MVTENITSVAEMKNCIEQVTRQLHSVLWINQTTPETNINCKTIVESGITYGVEVWETPEHKRKRLQAVETGYWRRCCRVTLQERFEYKGRHKRNNELMHQYK